MARIFLSYARDDVQPVQLIRRFLIAMGHDAWMDMYDLPPGSVFDVEIAEEIRRSDYVIICLSCHSVDHRGFVQREVKFALEEFSKVPPGRIFLIPVRLDECTVPYSLTHLTWVDNFEADSKVRILQAIIHPHRVDIDAVHQKMRDAELFSPFHDRGRHEYRNGNYEEAERLARLAYNEIPNPHSKLNEMVAACAQGKIIRRQLNDWVRRLKLEDSGHGQSVIDKGF
jgi:hypothetical protein